MFFLGIGGKLCQLEGLFIGDSAPSGRAGHTVSIETLIDVLLVLYDECCNSSLRREKTVSDFIEFGKGLFLLNLGEMIILSWFLNLICIWLLYTHRYIHISITLLVLCSETNNFMHQKLAIDTRGL